MQRLIRNAIFRKRTDSQLVFDPSAQALPRNLNLNLKFPPNFKSITSSRIITRPPLSDKKPKACKKTYLYKSKVVQAEIDPYLNFGESVIAPGYSQVGPIQNPFMSGINLSTINQSSLKQVPTLPNLNTISSSKIISTANRKKDVFIFNVKDIVNKAEDAELFESQMFDMAIQERPDLEKVPERDSLGLKIWEEFYQEEGSSGKKPDNRRPSHVIRMSVGPGVNRKSFKEDFELEANYLDPDLHPELFKTPLKVRLKSKTFKYDNDKWLDSEKEVSESKI